MMFVLTVDNQQIFYDEKNVYIDGNPCASYNDKHVIWAYDSTILVELKTYNDHSWAGARNFNHILLEAHNRDMLLKDINLGVIIGKYTGTPNGAIASYITYKKYLATKSLTASSATSLETPTIKKEIPTKKGEPTKKQIPRQQEQHVKEVPKHIQEKHEIKLPPNEEFEVPKPQKEYEYKKEEFKPPMPPMPPIPSGGSSGDSENGGCLGPIGGLALAIFIIIGAIRLIPQSWKDLSVYIPKGDLGITICFFSAVIGAVIALGYSLIKKGPKFTECISAFLGTCGLGILISCLMLLKDIFAGDYKFTGFILFDIPLAIFAPILGVFQFALPIGIGVVIICGIICLVKSQD